MADDDNRSDDPQDGATQPPAFWDNNQPVPGVPLEPAEKSDASAAEEAPPTNVTDVARAARGLRSSTDAAASAADAVAGGTAASTAAGSAAGAAKSAATAANAGLSTVAGGTSAAAGAASAAGAATGAAAGAAAAGASGVASVAGDVVGGTQAAASGDALGATDAVIRGAATAAATAAGSPAAGAVVNVALNTEVGRSTTRTASWLVIGLVGLILTGVIASSMIIISVLGAFLGGGAAVSSECKVPGSIVADDAHKQAAVDIMTVAYANNLGREGAVLGVMTALTESGLNVTAKDALQSSDTPRALLSVGIFQQKPFYWAHEVWPSGTTEQDPAFSNASYIDAAVERLNDPTTAAQKFFARLDSNDALKNGQWKSLEPWVAAQAIQRSSFADGSNYQAQYAAAQALVDQLNIQYPQIARSAQASTPLDQQAINLDNSSYLNTAKFECAATFNGDFSNIPDGFVLHPTGPSTFGGGQVVWEGASTAIARGLTFVGNAGAACEDGKCYQQCDGLAAEVWGYANSGFESAIQHWSASVQKGIAHPGDREPPLGALLFFAGGEYGHVATYAGNGMVISNWSRTDNPNVYLMPADYWVNSMTYLGWADPWFRGVQR